MINEQSARRFSWKPVALAAGILLLPAVTYGLGYVHGLGSIPESAPREIVLNGAADGESLQQEQLSRDTDLVTPAPEVAATEPLPVEGEPAPEALALAESPTPSAATAELTSGAPAALPANSLSAEEQELLEPAVASLEEQPALELASLDLAGLPTQAPAPDPLRIETLTVEPGDTLMGLLTDAGIARPEAYVAITALEEVFSPRRLRAGQEIKVALAGEAESQKLMSLSLRPDSQTDVLVDREEDGQFVALAKPRELTMSAEYGRGTISSSLYEASLDAGMPHGTLMELIRIYSFDVDFQRDIHEGDSFEALFELHYDEDGNIARTGDVRFASLVLGGKERRYYRYTTSEGETDYFDPEGKSVRRTLMRTPIDGARLSSGFGMRKHPVLGYSKMHKGTDFAAPTGTPIYAAGNGKVVVAGRNGGYGNYIRIRHNSRYQTAYAHLKGFARGISAGTRVEQGQIIGYVGSTGRSTGPHLHYEVLVDGAQVNPRQIKLPTGTVLAGADLEKFQMERAKIEQELASLAITDTQVAAGDEDCVASNGEGVLEQGSSDC